MNDDLLIPSRPRPDGAVGPGSQPAADDGVELSYLSMPGEMRTYRPPILPEPDQVAGLSAGLGLLRSLLLLLTGYRVGALPQVLDLATLPAADLRLVEDSLGAGEVSIQRGGAEPAQAQETRLAGVWRVQERDAGGRLRRDVLEVSDIPGFVRFGSFDGARNQIDLPAAIPDGIMNAPGVLAERLGTGALVILSRGYGNCRITATATRDIWWVQHYNSDDRLILSTLEVTGVPEAALAAQEDIEDSAERLGEILAALQ
jgi:hydrogenase-1 operon protein HyaF